MNLLMGRNYGKIIKKQIEGHNFEVGVLEDKAHYLPKEKPPQPGPKPAGGFDGELKTVMDLTTFAGGPAIRTSRIPSGVTVGQVLIANMERMKLNLLQKPFKDAKSAEIVKFTNGFLRFAMKHKGATIKRCENLLQAVVRNPILRQDYGANTPGTAEAKGFNRLMIATAQTFKNIKARAKRVRS